MKNIKIVLFFTALLCFMYTTEASAQVSIGISISAYTAPPPLPVYFQPPCPTDGYLWAPGYWAYTNDGYFWVPGVWVLPPQPGFYWTPGYWGYESGMYGFHTGYWGPSVGYYGGINYGYGYGGSGYGGGRWQGNSFLYNTAVVNVNRNVIHHTYSDRTVIVSNGMSMNRRTSYNGGRGGITARPVSQQQSAPNERHIQATEQQISHLQSASRDKNQFAAINHGRPGTTAMNVPDGHRYSQKGIQSNARTIPTLPPPNSVRPQTAPQVQNRKAVRDHSSAAQPGRNMAAPSHQQVQNNPAPRAQQQRDNPPQREQPQQHSNPSQGTPHQQHNNPPQREQPQQHVNPSQGTPHQQHNNPPQQHSEAQRHNAPQQRDGSDHQKDH